MINFKQVKFKNLLSFGNVETVIDLNRHSTTLIQGQSGSGKSTFIEAICFALFGKPFRKIVKKSILNTVNNKECLVELTFESSGVDYRIVRGIKPDIFEIYADGVLENQNPKVRDYQEYLETSILKMNYKTFPQICALGHANYTPFMMLSAGDRRLMVDEILGTTVFAKMCVSANVKAKEIMTTITSIDNSIKAKNDTITLLKGNLEKLQTRDEGNLTRIKEQIDIITANIESQMVEETEYLSKIKDLTKETSSLVNLKSKNLELVKIMIGIDGNISRVNKDIQFFENNASCPTCKQHITEEHVTPIKTELETKTSEMVNGKDKLQAMIDSSNTEIKTLEVIAKELTICENALNRIQVNIASKQRELKARTFELQSDVVEDTNITKETAQQIVNLMDAVNELKADKLVKQDLHAYYVVAHSMLKDDGIKASIIKQYIPVINKLTNEYLDAMGFTMKFSLDENFDETILSRFRDNMAYLNLSQGEQARISLALTLAWRDLAAQRNSASTSLLFLDEVLDSAINAADFDSVWGLIEKMSLLNNIMIISHKPDQIADKVRSIITVSKVGNFSKIG